MTLKILRIKGRWCLSLRCLKSLPSLNSQECSMYGTKRGITINGSHGPQLWKTSTWSSVKQVSTQLRPSESATTLNGTTVDSTRACLASQAHQSHPSQLRSMLKYAPLATLTQVKSTKSLFKGLSTFAKIVHFIQGLQALKRSLASSKLASKFLKMSFTPLSR